MAFQVPEELRVGGTRESGNNGAFVILGKTHRERLFVIASDGMGWEHVSVSKRYDTPTWGEMCRVKELFWTDPEDCVFQLHPPKSCYVNNHPYCLHLWRPIGTAIPIPNEVLVGVKNLGVLSV